jgi:competence ComEA-like helix-hairpin-helix protein
LRAQDDLPEGKGRVTLENTCSECHGLDRILTKLRPTAEWRSIVAEMRLKGATMSDDEFKTLVEYLAENFGEPERKAEADRKPQKVNVNRATGGELESALGLRASDAAAIVRHRESKGPFREWRDLLKVDGVDKARIEAVKDRLAF